VRRPRILSPAWFVLVGVIVVVGGIVAQLIDVHLFDSGDERFRWSGVIFFGVFMFLVQIVLALWTRRQRRAQGLS
jgi:hypothetical protein